MKDRVKGECRFNLKELCFRTDLSDIDTLTKPRLLNEDLVELVTCESQLSDVAQYRSNISQGHIISKYISDYLRVGPIRR